VEVGVGKRTGVMDILREMGMEVIGVDVNPVRGVVFDDVYRPNISIYQGAELVYSIRPPPDIWYSIAQVSATVRAELIIRPFSLEYVDLSEFYGK